MRAYYVVLVAVTTFLASGAALPAATGLSPNNEAIEAAARNDQRFLRSYKEEKDEDRDMAGVVKAVKAVSSRKKWREYVDEKKLKRIQKYFDDEVPYETLYKKKVDQYDVFRALKIHGKAETSKENVWWVGYYNYWVAMKEKGVKGG